MEFWDALRRASIRGLQTESPKSSQVNTILVGPESPVARNLEAPEPAMIAHADGNGYVCQDMFGQPPEAAIAPVHGHSDHCLDIAGIPSQADILPQSLVDSTVVAVMDGGSISLRGLHLALERQTGVCLVSRRHDIRNMVQRTLQHLGAVTGGCPGECTASSAAKRTSLVFYRMVADACCLHICLMR